MRNKFVASGFFRLTPTESLTGFEDGTLQMEFVPHQYDTMDDAKKGAEEFIQVSPSSVLFFRRHDGKFTFVPRAGDSYTMMIRTALALDGEPMEEEITILK